MLVVDACGVGVLPDAAEYGDAGTNTLAHVVEAVGGLELPTLGALGLGSIVELAGVLPAEDPVIQRTSARPGAGEGLDHRPLGADGRRAEAGPATYPAGFSPPVIARLAAATGCELICNRPYNGIAAIEDFGAEHLRIGALIPTPRRTRCCSSPLSSSGWLPRSSTGRVRPRGR
jgi:phosphopentomutase